MSQQIPATRPGSTASPKAGPHDHALTRPRVATADRDTQYAGGISLAAALGGTLLSVASRTHDSRLRRSPLGDLDIPVASPWPR